MSIGWGEVTRRQLLRLLFDLGLVGLSGYIIYDIMQNRAEGAMDHPRYMARGKELFDVKWMTFLPMVYKPPPAWRGACVPWQWPGRTHNTVGWWYDYRHQRQHMGEPNYVPMIWSHPEEPLTQLAIDFPGKHWMLFNEPDSPGQANMHWWEAADWYAQYYHEIKLGDPSAKIGGINLHRIAPDGQTCGLGSCPYFEQFWVRARNQGAELDFYCIHDWFGRYHNGFVGGALDWHSMELHLARVMAILGKQVPVWLTETAGLLGPGGTVQGELDFMASLMNWVNTTSGVPIVRLAWFSRYYAASQPWASNLAVSEEPDAPLSEVGRAWAGTSLAAP
jgi:hypothetical protein